MRPKAAAYVGAGALVLGGPNAAHARDWNIQTIESPGLVGKFTSLAFNDAGDAFVSYYDDSDEELHCAVFADGVPGPAAIEVVDNMDAVGMYSDIACDAAGHSHISYYDAINRDLFYARGVCLRRVGLVSYHKSTGSDAMLATEPCE